MQLKKVRWFIYPFIYECGLTYSSFLQLGNVQFSKNLLWKCKRKEKVVPNLFPGLRLKRFLRRLWASELKNWGIPNLALWKKERESLYSSKIKNSCRMISTAHIVYPDWRLWKTRRYTGNKVSVLQRACSAAFYTQILINRRQRKLIFPLISFLYFLFERFSTTVSSVAVINRKYSRVLSSSSWVLHFVSSNITLQDVQPSVI